MSRSSRKTLFLFFLVLSGYYSVHSATRWSTNHIIPDADLLEGGKYIVEAHTYLFSDSSLNYSFKTAGMFTLGIMEWVNIEAGYTGGFNLGIKARILGETKPWMPSLAIGVRNIFSHKEAYYYDIEPDSLKSELYLALGKGFDFMRVRFHGGFMSIPGNDREIFNPFVGVESYLGRGVYLTIEAHLRDRIFHPSAFLNWRFFKSSFELSAGAVDIAGMFSSKKSIDSTRSHNDSYVKPGVWIGLKFQGSLLGKGKIDGFTSIEERLAKQNSKIELLSNKVDSLQRVISTSSSRIESTNRAVSAILDSSADGQAQIDFLALQKIIALKDLYSQEFFEPEQVKGIIEELVGYKEEVLPALGRIAQDSNEDLKVRTLAISIMGETGLKAAADTLIKILSQAHTPEMKIECLIGLGKLKETRAASLMQELSNDTNDAVSYTANEVLQKLEKDTGRPLIKTEIPDEVPAISAPEEKTVSGVKDDGSDKKKIVTPDLKQSQSRQVTAPADSSAQKGTGAVSDSLKVPAPHSKPDTLKQ
ncbi:MAG TPA: hypothetical protein PLE24_15135 [Chitinispirillaceae bacterium]|nr:hypothetical protein [Chitinispirillaceae bacterium]